nr:reverse transcriptase domain-containing protein [Tanacetum cinerariifolium]
MALADLGANINLMLLSVWEKLMRPKLVPTRITLELANRSIAYPDDSSPTTDIDIIDPIFKRFTDEPAFVYSPPPRDDDDDDDDLFVRNKML